MLLFQKSKENHLYPQKNVKPYKSLPDEHKFIEFNLYDKLRQ